MPKNLLISLRIFIASTHTTRRQNMTEWFNLFRWTWQERYLFFLLKTKKDDGVGSEFINFTSRLTAYRGVKTFVDVCIQKGGQTIEQTTNTVKRAISTAQSWWQELQYNSRSWLPSWRTTSHTPCHAEHRRAAVSGLTPVHISTRSSLMHEVNVLPSWEWLAKKPKVHFFLNFSWPDLFQNIQNPRPDVAHT